jgi:hypothetical protein
MQNPLDKEQTIAVGELDAAAHLACSTISCCTIISPELSACFNHALDYQARVDGERWRTGVVLAQLGGPCEGGPCEGLESQKADERDSDSPGPQFIVYHRVAAAPVWRQ